MLLPADFGAARASASRFRFRSACVDHRLREKLIICASNLWAVGLGAVWLIAAGLLTRRQYGRDRDARTLPVHRDDALEAVKLLREWCTWFATISTVAIGATGLLAGQACNSSCDPRVVAVVSVCAFLTACICAAILLLALPSVTSRLKRGRPSIWNDLYELPAFLFMEKNERLARVGYLAAMQALCFSLGLAGFGVYVVLRG